MTIAPRVFIQIVLMILLRRIKVFQRADLHQKGMGSARFYGGDPLHRPSRLFIGIINARLILTAHIIPLPVFYGGVNDIKIRQQQCVQADLPGVIGHLHGLTKAGVSGADSLITRLPRPVGIAALGVYHAGYGLHQLLHAPKATAGQIDHLPGTF